MQRMVPEIVSVAVGEQMKIHVLDWNQLHKLVATGLFSPLCTFLFICDS